MVKDLFVMHRGERRAFAVLLVACLVAAAWIIYEQCWRPAHPERMAELDATWAEWEREDSITTRPSADQRLFSFDPNGLPVEQWMALGLSRRQAAAIHRYEARGGRFRCKTDLARMHVVAPELFARWEPYIQLPDKAPVRAAGRDDLLSSALPAPPAPPHADPVRVELNTADTAQLIQVRGIGPAFARSIVKYRDKLGGFHSLDQLSEVYILRDKPEAVEKLKRTLTLDPGQVHRIAVNTCAAEDLGPHPYAGWKVAKALVAYRKMHGPFQRVEDIKGCALVTDSVYQRLAPYLSIGP